MRARAYRRVKDALSQLESARTPAAASALGQAIQAFMDELLPHLRHEEDHLIAMPRKYVNLAIHKQIVRKVSGADGAAGACGRRGQCTVAGHQGCGRRRG